MTVHAAPVEESAWPSVAVAGDLARARREWIHTNGAGAYASSTIAGMHARRYHGLLIAALDPPQGRHLFLSHVDATIALPREGSGPPSRQRWDLAKHQFPSVDPTTGPFYLQRFDQDPLPRWTYAVPAGELEITLALVRGENAAVLRYRFRGKRPVLLTLRPLLAARGFQKLQRENGGMLQRVELRPGEMRVQPRKDLPRVCFRYEGTFVGSPDWWRRFEYLEERDRGLDYEEDLWTPGVFELSIGDAPSYLVAGVDHLPHGEPEELILKWFAARKNWNKEVRETMGESPPAGMDSPMLLTNAAARHYRGYKGKLSTWAAACYQPWMAIKDKVRPVESIVWMDDHMLNDAVAWAAERKAAGEGGIIWCEFREIGLRVAKAIGVDYYTGQEWGATLRAEKGDRVVVCSIRGFGTGTNLQRFTRHLVLSNPASAETWQQLLGRPHRAGQTKSVHFEVYRHTPELRSALDKALERAEWIERFDKEETKLCFSTKDW